MSPWTNRKTLAAAYDWKREEEGRLTAEIHIQEVLLRATRTQLARLRKLEGQNLAIYYSSLDQAEVEKTMKSKQEFIEEITELFQEAMLAGTW